MASRKSSITQYEVLPLAAGPMTIRMIAGESANACRVGYFSNGKERLMTDMAVLRAAFERVIGGKVGIRRSMRENIVIRQGSISCPYRDVMGRVF